MENLKIKLMSIEDIVEDVNNTKEHPDWQIENIKNSIEEYKYIDPIVICEKNEILAGHGRYRALLLLGRKEIEVIQVLHLNEEQKIKYRIINNKTTMSTGLNLEQVKLNLEKLDMTNISKEEIKIFSFTEEEINKLDLGIEEIKENDFTEFEDEKTKSMKYLTLRNKKIPITLEEEEKLFKRLEEYIEEKGTLFGFIGELLC